MARDMFLGELKNIEYKVTLPEHSEKYMKKTVAFANKSGKLIGGIDDKAHQIVGVSRKDKRTRNGRCENIMG